MIEQLENDLGILSEWFKNNYKKLNIDKCKLLTNKEKDTVSIKMDSDIISNTAQVKLLRTKALPLTNMLQYYAISKSKTTCIV